MPIIEIQHVPGSPKERVIVPAGMSFYQWLCGRNFFSDIEIVVNGKPLDESGELDFPLTEMHSIQIFSQPKGVIGKVLSPAFKLVQKVFGFLMPKQKFTAADTNAKESPNNKLTGQTNVARTYQARPDVYGQVRSYPDLIQESMFEYTDNLKYVTEWMNFGIGVYNVESVRYSQSSLGSLAGASYEIFQPGQNIPIIYEGFSFDDVDGQELPGPNESDDLPIETATANTVAAGEYAGGQISVKIVKQAEFDYFYGLTRPHPVSFIINVTYDTASGQVTRDVMIDADLFDAEITSDGSVIAPQSYYIFYFNNISGSDASNIPQSAIFNTDKFILNDNQGVTIGPVFSPIPGEQLWVHLNAQLGEGNWASTKIDIWKIDDENNQIPGTREEFSAEFSTAGRTDNYYLTKKINPSAGYGRYALQFTRRENSNDQSVLKLEAVHSVRVRTNEVHADDTLVRVTVRATEQATSVRERKYNALITRHTISYDMATRKVDYTLRPSRSFADAVAHTWLVMGEQPESSIDLYELYRIGQNITAELGYFDYTFDDEDISLGSRMETICNVARVSAFWEFGVLTFSRDERRSSPATIFNRANMVAEDFRLTYDMRMPGQYDGVEVEYVSPATNKKSYIRYRLTDAGIVEQEAQTPMKISLLGCRNETQARDRAILEARRLLYSRMRMACKVLADGEYVSPGDMIQVADTYDTNQQAGYITNRTGNDFDTSERINWLGEMWVTVTDSIGNPTSRVRASQRSDTAFGFTATVPNVPLNIFDGYDVQSPSRYVIATQEEMDSTLWTISEKKPNSDGTTSLTLAEYSDLIYP
ncbi:host specificity factor TipJ family phage tail protein [Rouxiella sp. Mn2063]|uniref:host specificity factor TipJ family phage tail protein n=1 Tax=Rouxiella sp. Mn2063 TaxID=3395262 RepID=UPI003BDEB998